ncbi:sugar ABC transporter substrate-binding protein [Nonomuraea roseoviolacea subsp. roseoviolacea]|uniref:ABC-type glycerol-3-phosphate transport system substrate-binding protein n=1 Tax=Nonomuraea roseoviolacea subsp. carminata TaxID=160689 RepID=A0ABT1K928_9ACTN|nr:sugar ABC transporter substrate-binding protein [Nonomuraea roseoviolacea]MCP2350518.1 ABC-type glycerol-3-phosphate transport system substrate-binding protein [Nonomuraea roseoviolacea subsp. carminata]
MRMKSALAAAAIVALAAGCGSGGGGDKGGSKAEPGEPVKLNFLSLAWQKESVAANKQIVDEWNKANPTIQVTYVQGSWDNVNDQLVTQFAGGTAPDVIHNDSPALSGFASDGYLLDLSDKLPAELKSDIPQKSWDTVTFDDGKGKQGVYGVPFLQESQVIIANKKLLDGAGVRIPTPDNPWTWDEFSAAAKKMTKGGTFGVAWPMKSPVNKTLNLALNFGGTFFQTTDGKTTVKVGPEEKQVLQRIHDQLYKDKSADPAALGQGTADPLPAFYSGKFALLPAGVYLRQQVAEQAPKGFEWVTLPPLKGTTADQGAVSQTLSVAQDSKHPDEALKFISYFLNPTNQAKLAKGDWLLPTSVKAASDPSMTTKENGWDVATASAKNLVVAPFLKVNGFDEWKSKVATPALQEYFANKISIDDVAKKLVDDGNKVLERYQR